MANYDQADYSITERSGDVAQSLVRVVYKISRIDLRETDCLGSHDGFTSV